MSPKRQNLKVAQPTVNSMVYGNNLWKNTDAEDVTGKVYRVDNDMSYALKRLTINLTPKERHKFSEILTHFLFL